MNQLSKTPTIKEIAQLAGVSRGTVDRVLNNREGVNAETAARVKAIADELNYKPNLVAKSLSKKGAIGGRSIGVLTGVDDNPFFDDVKVGIMAKAVEIEDFGFQIRFGALKEFDVELQLKEIDRLIDSGISGLILSPINRPPLADKLRELKARQIPVVCLNTDVKEAPRICYVGSDYKQCGKVAAGLFGLLSNGKPQKLAIVTGSFMHLGHDMRVAGFRECINEDFPNFEIASVVENNDNDELSYKATKRILGLSDLTGIFFGGAGIEGGIAALEDAGRLGEVSVICVDLIDVVKKHLASGGVTATICQEPYKQGFEAVRVMFELLLGNKKPESDIFTETQIIIKHSL